MSAFDQRAGGLRMLRIFVLALAVGVMLNSAGWAYTFKLNADRVDQINAERARNTLAACEGQNARHDETIRALDRLIADSPPERRERAKQGRASTVFLLEAIVPHRDCAALVRAQVHP